ncbi:methylated-DNA--[protein]-cysteine S-methyltransferase [uncultured Psychrobacter sp.]|uniref:methylated-DNA--[protein]-cysteine S-methyltransferase n=1 Tax=uncultured Psychrobacter sp. TaxID=259303 RepID=UPI003458DDFF
MSNILLLEPLSSADSSVDSVQGRYYQSIEKAINFIIAHHEEQPSLVQIAEHVHMSRFHFQRVFSDWAGTSPKRFLQYITLQHAQSLLHEHSILDTTYSVGLSSTSRLHELFVKIEGMSPAQYKQGGRGLIIKYSFYNSLFGLYIVASTSKGICLLSFCDNAEHGLKLLEEKFPQAKLVAHTTNAHKQVMAFFANPIKFKSTDYDPIKLHLKGTPFQLKVWEALLNIPMANLTTYSVVAKAIDKPNAQRAVGSAIGKNPIAFLIPCHRVIKKTGTFGNYRWGQPRKASMIGWEACQLNLEKD